MVRKWLNPMTRTKIVGSRMTEYFGDRATWGAGQEVGSQEKRDQVRRWNITGIQVSRWNIKERIIRLKTRSAPISKSCRDTHFRWPKMLKHPMGDAFLQKSGVDMLSDHLKQQNIYLSSKFLELYLYLETFCIFFEIHFVPNVSIWY